MNKATPEPAAAAATAHLAGIRDPATAAVAGKPAPTELEIAAALGTLAAAGMLTTGAKAESDDADADDDGDEEGKGKAKGAKSKTKAKSKAKSKSKGGDNDKDDDDDQDGDSDDDEGDDEAKAVSAARQAERARCAAILKSEHAKGRADVAQTLAFESDLSTEAAISVMAKLGPAPTAATAAPTDMAELLASVPRVEIGAGGGPAPAADSAEAIVAAALAVGRKVGTVHKPA
jgi:hypothetical protein